MIQSIFPTISGVAPYRTKHQQTYSTIKIYETPYSVKSRGCTALYYAWATYSLSPAFDQLKFTGNTPFVKMYAGKSYPIELAPEAARTAQFGIIYNGYYIPESASATFYLKGTGRARMQVAGGFDTGTVQLGTDRPSVVSLRVTGMTAGVGKLSTITYMSPDRTSQKENVFVVTWKDSTLPNEIPLAAGNFKSQLDYLSGITEKTLQHVGDARLSRQHGQTTEFTFSVPIVPSGSTIGYSYVESGDYLRDESDPTRTIKKFRMVEFYSGYKYPNGSTSTIKKFVGQVRGWTITRKQDGSDIAVVKCHDWSSFLSDSLNEGIPNVADYLIADYLDPVSVDGVAGDTKPRTYDGWELSKVLDSLMYNAVIDPKTIYAKKQHIDVTGTIVDGLYAVHDRNSTNPILLDKAFKYGNPLGVVQDGADDPYVWQFSIGDYISDNVQKLMENYGFQYGFNNIGNFYVNSVKNPIYSKSIDEITMVSNWEEVTNPKMIYGVSKQTQTSGDTALATFSGRSCRLIHGVGPNFGTLHIRLSNSTLGIVATVDISLYNTSNRNYFDGVDDTLGYNPCEISIGEGLAYGAYSLNLECKSNASVSVNAVLINDEQYFSEVDVFYSGDTVAVNGVITDNLTIESDVDNIRNDVIVVGRLLGVKSNLSLAEGENANLNPNNPVSEHITGRAVDRVAIASVSNDNFTGRKLQTIIIDPAIATGERASWLAIETAKRYNKFNKSMAPRFSMITHPLLELNDRIAVNDIKLGVLSTTQDFWISGIEEHYGADGKSQAVLQVESFEPWGSYFKYATPSLSRFNNTVFTNVVAYNTGLPLNAGNEFCYLHNWLPNSTNPGTIEVIFKTKDTTTTTTEVENRVPQFGYVKVHSEVIAYESRSVSRTFDGLFSYSYFKVALGGLTRGMYNTSTIADISNYEHAAVELQISPYTTEEYGVGPSVGFDLIAPGYVKVDVLSDLGVVVDTPTNAEDANDGWVFLEPGSYIYTWGCLDRYGVYNESNSGYFGKSGSQTYDTPTQSTDVLGDWNPFFGPMMYPDDQYKVGADRYVVNRARSKYGKFSFDVRYRDPSSQITNEIKKVSGIKPIHTVMRITGNSIAFDSTTDGIHEEFRLNTTSDISDSTLGTIWYSDTVGRVISNVNALTASPNYRRFYTGSENGGVGFKINIKNKHVRDRIVDVEVVRYVFSFIRIYRERYKISQTDGARWVTETGIELVDSGTDTIIPSGDFSWNVDDANGLDLYIPAPIEGFITPALSARIDKALNEDSNGLTGDFNRKDRIKSLAVAQVHCFEIRTTDFSGFKDALRRSVWYVGDEFINTESEFLAGTQKISAFDGVNPYESMVFTWRDTVTNNVYSMLGMLPGTGYKEVIVTYDENTRNALYTEGIYGVKIYGDYL